MGMGAAYAVPNPDRETAMRRLVVLAVALLLASAVPVSAQTVKQSFVHDPPNASQTLWRVDTSDLWYYNSSGTAQFNVDLSTGDVIIQGDISAAGGYKMLYVFAHQGVGTSVDSHAPIAGAIVSASDTSYVYEVKAPWAGSVMGVSLVSSAALTAGDAHVEVTTGTCGATQLTGTGLIAFLASTETETTYDAATQAKGTDTFTAGQCIGADLETGSAFAPIGTDLVVIVYVEM